MPFRILKELFAIPLVFFRECLIRIPVRIPNCKGMFQNSLGVPKGMLQTTIGILKGIPYQIPLCIPQDTAYTTRGILKGVL